MAGLHRRSIFDQTYNLKCIWRGFAFLLLMLPLPALAQTTYSKSMEFSALRVSYDELQSMLDKAHALVASANKYFKSYQEEVALQAEEIKITLAGYKIEPPATKIPNQVTGFSYSYAAPPDASVNQLNLDFSDYRRVLNVRGTSVEQVDAVFAVLSAELTKASTPIGGQTFRWIFLYFMSMVYVPIGIVAVWNWYETRFRRYTLSALASIAILILVFTLPFEQIFAGFLASRGDPSMFVRYGPQISFVGLFPAIWAVGRWVLGHTIVRNATDQ